MRRILAALAVVSFTGVQVVADLFCDDYIVPYVDEDGYAGLLAPCVDDDGNAVYVDDEGYIIETHMVDVDEYAAQHLEECLDEYTGQQHQQGWDGHRDRERGTEGHKVGPDEYAEQQLRDFECTELESITKEGLVDPIGEALNLGTHEDSTYGTQVAKPVRHHNPYWPSYRVHDIFHFTGES